MYKPHTGLNEINSTKRPPSWRLVSCSHVLSGRIKTDAWKCYTVGGEVTDTDYAFREGK